MKGLKKGFFTRDDWLISVRRAELGELLGVEAEIKFLHLPEKVKTNPCSHSRNCPNELPMIRAGGITNEELGIRNERIVMKPYSLFLTLVANVASRRN